MSEEYLKMKQMIIDTFLKCVQYAEEASFEGKKPGDLEGIYGIWDTESLKFLSYEEIQSIYFINDMLESALDTLDGIEYALKESRKRLN